MQTMKTRKCKDKTCSYCEDGERKRREALERDHRQQMDTAKREIISEQKD